MNKTLLSIIGATCAFTSVIAQCGNFGTGVDGAYAPSSSTTLAGGTYNYTSFTIPAGVTITVTGASPLVIYSEGAVNIDGTLNANGANGINGVTFSNGGAGGLGVAGGGNGGAGSFSSPSGPITGVAGTGQGGLNTQGAGWSGGGGAGYAAVGASSGGVGGFGGPAYGTAPISGVDAGSGGGGGSGGYDCGAGGGGGGGGYISMSAPSITISASGVISANGGNGGSDGTGNCGGGGGGSGGSIWLSAPSMTHNGVISATGGLGGISTLVGAPYYGVGGVGSIGRLRLDYNGMLAGSGTNTPAIGHTQPISTLQTAAVVTQNVSCFGGNDGAALATNMNGNPPYTQTWAPTGGNSTAASGLTAGTYTYTVTDNSGCTATATVTINQPTAIVVTITSNNALCFGTANGSATASVSGGTPGYTFSWVPSGGTSATATNLSAGCYTCTVTDANGCTTTQTVCITEPPLLSVSTSVTPTSCNGGCDGSALAFATGGVPNYNYMWSPTTPSCAGTYFVIVTDQNGCTANGSATITEPPPAQVSILGVDTTICEPASITVCASGAMTYLWNNGSTAPCVTTDTTECFFVHMSDSSGCTSVDTICITDDLCLGISESMNDVNLIYPNPASTFIRIQHNSGDKVPVEIIDITGKVCISREVENNGEMNIASLSEGIYTVRINGSTQKLVITR